MERFAELNVHGFEVFTEILSRCLGQMCLLLSIIKERHLYSREKFCGTTEKCESLAQQSFAVYGMASNLINGFNNRHLLEGSVSVTKS